MSVFRMSLGIGATVLLGLASCITPVPPPRVGGLYSIDNGDGWFGIVKVLALDPGVVSLRVYSNFYEERPTSVDPTTLWVTTLDLDALNADRGQLVDIGSNHVPLSEEAFAAWRPRFISDSTVTDEELAAYRKWKTSREATPR